MVQATGIGCWLPTQEGQDTSGFESKYLIQSWKKCYIQPLNILFDSHGRLKICDLGLVTDIVLINGQEVDKTRTNIGTPMYMAPEQVGWLRY